METIIEKSTFLDWKFQEIAAIEKEEKNLFFCYARVKDHFKNYDNLIFGKGGNHIWFALKDRPDQRIAIIKKVEA
jgi:hypothetical protein